MDKSINFGDRLYFVSEDGILSNEKGFVYKLQDNGNGYKYISLGGYNTIRKHFYVHRLVATLYVDNPFKFKEVNHIDGDKSNNSAGNLEWITRIGNIWDYKNKGRAKYIPRKPVLQFSIKGEIIKEWDSPQTAAKSLKCTKELIQMAANPNAKAVISAKGFKWLYKELINTHALKEYANQL